MKVLNTLLEFAAVAAIALFFLLIWQKFLSTSYLASASANRTNTETALLGQAGEGVLGLLGWGSNNRG